MTWAAQAGGFERLARRYYAGVYDYLRWLCRDEDLAADLTQETFVQAWRHPPEFRGEPALKAWVFRIARNAFLQHHRRAGIQTLALEFERGLKRAYLDHSQARKSLTMDTRGREKVAVLTVTGLRAGARRVVDRMVLEVDPQTKRLLAMRSYEKTPGGRERLVATVDKVEYDVPIPARLAAKPTPKKTIPAEVTIRRTDPLDLVMKAGDTVITAVGDPVAP